MTPLKGLTWIYNEIYLNKNKDDEIWYQQMEWADNPFLDKEEVMAMTKSLSNDELESRRYGNFMQSGGLVYNEFDEPIIDKEEAIIEMNGKWGMIFVYGRFGKVKTLIPMRFKEVFRSYRLGKRIVEVMRIDSYGNRVTNVYNLNWTMDEIREEYFKKLRGKLKRSR